MFTMGQVIMMGTEDIKLSERNLIGKKERLKGYLDYSVLSGKINGVQSTKM